MKTAARVLTFVGAGIGLLIAVVSLFYKEVFNHVLEMAETKPSTAELSKIEEFFKWFLMYLGIAGLVSAGIGLIAGAVISSSNESTTIKIMGVLCIFVGFFTNIVLFIGGIFAVSSAAKMTDSSRNNSSNGDYTVYR